MDASKDEVFLAYRVARPRHRLTGKQVPSMIRDSLSLMGEAHREIPSGDAQKDLIVPIFGLQHLTASQPPWQRTKSIKDVLKQ